MSCKYFYVFSTNHSTSCSTGDEQYNNQTNDPNESDPANSVNNTLRTSKVSIVFNYSSLVLKTAMDRLLNWTEFLIIPL